MNGALDGCGADSTPQDADIEHINTEHFAAFTVAELGELLPADTFFHKRPYKGTMRWYAKRLKDEYQKKMVAETEVEVRGNKLAYLVENKLITLP